MPDAWLSYGPGWRWQGHCSLQASGEHAKQILASWANDKFGNSIAIGTSSVHTAISHLKIVIVDGA
jgi:hypothetical protein